MSLRYRWLVKEKGANCIVTNPEILKYMELQEKSARAWKDKGWNYGIYMYKMWWNKYYL